jgi:hypothetical protein
MADPSEADVYVDVVFDDGLLFLVVCNDGVLPAEQVRVAFDRPVLGADGLDVGRLGAFTRLEFLAPGKRLRVYLDHANAYFARRQRSRISMKVTWRVGRMTLSSSMTHDMRVYADLPYIVRQPDHRRIGHVRRSPHEEP